MLKPMMEAEFKYRVDRAFGVKRTVANVITSESTESAKENIEDDDPGIPLPADGGFANLSTQGNNIVPVSTEFGIVIEKINANAKVVADVDAGDEKSYVKALETGVAEALGSTAPGKPGNLYLFSHSTDAPWNIVRFNAIFYLLRELEIGDRIIVFYNNKRYDYTVYDKTIAKPGDVSYLTNRYNIPVLTLQTCDPPGTLLNRLIIRAKLVNT